jgi:hypothetical protein
MSQPPAKEQITSLTDQFYRQAGRHFVTLSCIRKAPGQTTPDAFVFSGYVISAGGVWIYITAGHVVRDIRHAQQHGYTYDRWRLDDQTAGSRFGGMAIPYAFEVDEWTEIYNEVTGLDYAFVPLDNLFRMNLEKGGVIAIGKEAWGDHLMEHDQWALIGMPHETVQYDSFATLSGRVALFPLVPCAPPELAGQTVENKFFAKIVDMGNINSVVGMSGGPVFALTRDDDGRKYKVIGVQSGWYPGDHIVAICPIASLASELERLVGIALGIADSSSQ